MSDSFQIRCQSLLFCLFLSYSQNNDRYSTKFDYKSINDVIGIRTGNLGLVGSDMSTELWRPLLKFTIDSIICQIVWHYLSGVGSFKCLVYKYVRVHSMNTAMYWDFTLNIYFVFIIPSCYSFTPHPMTMVR